MKNAKVAKSTRPGKKYQAKFEDGPTVHFGAAGMSDYMKNKDPERKKAYIERELERRRVSRLLVTLPALAKAIVAGSS
jgi:hypothetical protein